MIENAHQLAFTHWLQGEYRYESNNTNPLMISSEAFLLQYSQLETFEH